MVMAVAQFNGSTILTKSVRISAKRVLRPIFDMVELWGRPSAESLGRVIACHHSHPANEVNQKTLLIFTVIRCGSFILRQPLAMLRLSYRLLIVDSQ